MASDSSNHHKNNSNGGNKRSALRQSIKQKNPEESKSSGDHLCDQVSGNIDLVVLELDSTPTDSIEEVFRRLPLPYSPHEFKIHDSWFYTLSDNLEPPPYEHIKRNIYLVKKKKVDNVDYSIGCRCCGSKSCNNCICSVQHISCSNACICTGMCANSPFPIEKKVKVVMTNQCGWGLEALEFIPKGDYIIEYVGEVISDILREERLFEMEKSGVTNTYMCAVKKDFTIDATLKGNAARFINHSCDPNCILKKWDVKGELCLRIYAAKSIKPGEQLTYDYRLEHYGPEIECHCGAATCKGYLGTNTRTLSFELVDWVAKRRRTAS
ncbi:histone-lysine N-methyltransferase ASHR3-like [Rutidosis leptorrhynchoides]|uniref:histone-lysine N-methyltransferase ASHR3-like n=1 Tax=Rutidosis leptorrhynchoides TaxID=125765 RepID=UPI003A995723